MRVQVGGESRIVKIVEEYVVARSVWIVGREERIVEPFVRGEWLMLYPLGIEWRERCFLKGEAVSRKRTCDVYPCLVLAVE